MHDSLQVPVVIRRYQQVQASCDNRDYRKADMQHKIKITNWKNIFLVGRRVCWLEPSAVEQHFSDMKNVTETVRITSGSIGTTCSKSSIFFREPEFWGGIMLWGAFSAKGQSQLTVLRGNQNSDFYKNKLSDYVLPFSQRCHCSDWIFQQDNIIISIHTSETTKIGFRTMM